MIAVTQADVKKATESLNIKQGDTVLIHSSFKSMGYVEGGAESVIAGFLDVLGESGTLILPTFVQKNFTQAYETWHLDKESDVGYLTNYFRKRPGSVRSDQATHSVAACGKLAHFLTETHGHTHKRFGCYGDTPFSADSPWEKMYHLNTKIVLLGVGPKETTFRHYAEYVYVNTLLDTVKGRPGYDELAGRLLQEYKGLDGVWPAVYSPWVVDRLMAENAVTFTQLGNAKLTCFGAKTFVDTVWNALRSEQWDILKWQGSETMPWHKWVQWVEDFKKIQPNL